MPRKTGITTPSFPITPYEQGPSIIDAEGDSMTQDDVDALRVYPIAEGGAGIAELVSASEESLLELKKIRIASERILGQEVSL